jgi:putative pyruvate formate lyase activating enzyme
MSDLTHLKIWDDPAICDNLSWYLDVAENRRPAKFRIAATLATQIDPAAASEDALWAEFDRLTPIFLGRWQQIRVGAPLPPTADGPSVLELCRELAYRMLTHCNFCPWNCRVDRMAGAKFGACKLASASRVSSHFHHTGEELLIAARKARARSSSPPATCGVHFARTATSRLTRTTARRRTRAR